MNKTNGGPMNNRTHHSNQGLKKWIFICLLPLACSKQGGFENKVSNCTGAACDNTQLENPTPTPAKVVDLTQLEGVVSGGSYDNHLAFKVDKPSNSIIISMPLGINYYVGNMSGEVASMPGVTYKVEINPNNGQAVFKIKVPVQYFIKGGQFTDKTATLPNGDPIPMFPDGEPPTTALTFAQNDVSGQIYLSPGAFGVFITTPFDPYLSLTMPIKNKAKTKVLGYFSLVRKKNGFNGGFFMSLILPPEIAQALEDSL